ncbi:hypothetical protein [Bacillus cytotoxicus]|uniref:hypothetical protein n=1 Tax=Bacillus cytotoxicus TaxID=580165 RepID=UPI003D7EF373
MKVICINNKCNQFSDKRLKQGYTHDMILNLEVRKEYVVYGMSLSNGELDYQLLGENENMPSWYPAELFNVSDPLQPLEWYFADHRHIKETTIDYIWGYKELALEDSHAFGLIEREKKDMEILLKRKAEIDEFMEL